MLLLTVIVAVVLCGVDAERVYYDLSNVTLARWNCTVLPPVPFARIRFFMGANPVADVICNPGFRPMGDRRMLCIDNEWHYYKFPYCLKGCAPITGIEHSSVKYDLFPEESGVYRDSARAYIGCEEDYIGHPPENQHVECLNGTWSKPFPTCEVLADLDGVGCPVPRPVNYAFIKNITPLHKSKLYKDVYVYNIGDIIEYVCEENRFMVGVGRWMCTNKKKWSERITPSCMEICE